MTLNDIINELLSIRVPPNPYGYNSKAPTRGTELVGNYVNNGPRPPYTVVLLLDHANKPVFVALCGDRSYIQDTLPKSYKQSRDWYLFRWQLSAGPWVVTNMILEERRIKDWTHEEEL